MVPAWPRRCIDGKRQPGSREIIKSKKCLFFYLSPIQRNHPEPELYWSAAGSGLWRSWRSEADSNSWHLTPILRRPESDRNQRLLLTTFALRHQKTYVTPTPTPLMAGQEDAPANSILTLGVYGDKCVAATHAVLHPVWKNESWTSVFCCPSSAFTNRLLLLRGEMLMTFSCSFQPSLSFLWRPNNTSTHMCLC